MPTFWYPLSPFTHMHTHARTILLLHTSTHTKSKVYLLHSTCEIIQSRTPTYQNLTTRCSRIPLYRQFTTGRYHQCVMPPSQHALFVAVFLLLILLLVSVCVRACACACARVCVLCVLWVWVRARACACISPCAFHTHSLCCCLFRTHLPSQLPPMPSQLNLGMDLGCADIKITLSTRRSNSKNAKRGNGIIISPPPHPISSADYK